MTSTGVTSGAQKPTTPRETTGSRSPRRVDKIDGVRDEGLSWLKLMANELKDSPVSEESADAERQTKDTWCGLRGGDWWLASVASMATEETVGSMVSVASVALVVSMDWWRRVASIAPVMMMVLRASLTLEAQKITNVNDLLLLRSWASTKIGELLKRDTQKRTLPRVTDGSRSPRRVEKIDGARVEGLSTIGWLRLAPMASMASMVVWMA